MAKRSFAVIGLGRFGSAMATTLAELGHEVIGIDGNEEKVARLSDVVSQAVQLDATDEKAIKAAGIQDVDVAIISIGENIESSVLVAMLVKELGIPTIVAPLADDRIEAGDVLSLLGSTERLSELEALLKG